MDEILSPALLRFQKKVCKDCVYYVANKDIGLGVQGGYCDYIGQTGHARILDTPRDQLHKSCPLKRIPGEKELKRRAKRLETRAKQEIGKPEVEVLRSDGTLVGVYASVRLAGEAVGIDPKRIYRLMQGVTKHNITGYVVRRKER